MTDFEKQFAQIAAGLNIDDQPNAEHKKTLRQQMLTACKESSSAKTAPRIQPIWSKIMKSNITKSAAAAVVMGAVLIGINMLNGTPAYAIEQTIEAYNSVRFLQVKQFKANHDEPLEYWIKSDGQGKIEKARYYLPEHVSPEDGAKLITWTPEKAELWFKRKNAYLIFQSNRIEGMMQDLLQKSQPKLVMEKLLQDCQAGIIEMQTEQPQEKHKPVMVTVTNAKSMKTIYYINPATDLITSVETYEIKGSRDILICTTEYYDYNVPIDEKMFTIADEVPEDVTVVDQLSRLIGIPQGNMTDEEAAVETVRQFWQALIDKDYEKAGLIFSGVSEEKAKEYFSCFNITSIISVGPPTPYPKCGEHSFSVPCKVELIMPDGQKRIREFRSVKARCGDDEMHPDRWIIHGGI